MYDNIEIKRGFEKVIDKPFSWGTTRRTEVVDGTILNGMSISLGGGSVNGDYSSATTIAHAVGQVGDLHIALVVLKSHPLFDAIKGMIELPEEELALKLEALLWEEAIKERGVQSLLISMLKLGVRAGRTEHQKQLCKVMGAKYTDRYECDLGSKLLARMSRL